MAGVDELNLRSLADLAVAMQLPLSTVTDLAAREAWPHVRLGRAKRFTPIQVDQIIATHTVIAKAEKTEAIVELTGLTKRSARSS